MKLAHPSRFRSNLIERRCFTVLFPTKAFLLVLGGYYGAQSYTADSVVMVLRVPGPRHWTNYCEPCGALAVPVGSERTKIKSGVKTIKELLGGRFVS